MLLKSRSLPYEEIKIDDEAERLAFYAKCGPSVRQMPQIFINDQRGAGWPGCRRAWRRSASKHPHWRQLPLMLLLVLLQR